MSFLDIPAKVRRDQLGASAVNALRGNHEWLRRVAATEHIVTSGEHNAIEVPRIACRMDFNGGASTYAESPTSTDIGTITRSSAGVLVVNLAASRFAADPLVCQFNLNDADAGNKPYMFGYKVVSATQIEVYIKKLSSALGAGNTWVAADADFDMAIHSSPLSAGSWTEAQPGLFGVREALDYAEWNKLVRTPAEAYAILTQAHTSAGVHSVKEVSRYWAAVQYQPTGTKYEVIDGSGITVNRTATGTCEVTFAALTSPVMPFVSTDYQRQAATPDATELFLANAAESTTTKVIVYLFKYDRSAKTWALADGDFNIVVHGS